MTDVLSSISSCAHREDKGYQQGFYFQACPRVIAVILRVIDEVTAVSEDVINCRSLAIVLFSFCISPSCTHCRELDLAAALAEVLHIEAKAKREVDIDLTSGAIGGVETALTRHINSVPGLYCIGLILAWVWIRCFKVAKISENTHLGITVEPNGFVIARCTLVLAAVGGNTVTDFVPRLEVDRATSFSAGDLMSSGVDSLGFGSGHVLRVERTDASDTQRQIAGSIDLYEAIGFLNVEI